jgi:hypothetical protein
VEHKIFVYVIYVIYVRNVYINMFGQPQVKSVLGQRRDICEGSIEMHHRKEGMVVTGLELDPVGPQKLATPVNSLHLQQGYSTIREIRFFKLFLIC